MRAIVKADATLQPWLDLAKQQGGLVAMLAFMLYAGFKRWWVWGWYVERVERERDEWKRLAIQGTRLAETYDEILRHPAS